VRLHGKAGRPTSEIFISYRREDASAYAGRIYDRLVKEFEKVWMDVGALKPGADFVEHIHAAVGSADAFLVVIGRGWLNAKDEDGGRRLDDPDDFVRTEVALALAGKPLVIPVLVGGAVMPDDEELPPDLVPLAHRHAVTLIHEDWEAGIARLVTALREIVEPVAVPEPSPPPPEEPSAVEPEPPPTRRPVLATALGLAGAVALVAGTWLQLDHWAHPTPEKPDPDGLGYLSSITPMTVAVGAIGSLLLSYARGAAGLATGLFLGFALAGAARSLSLLGIFANTKEPSRFLTGAWIALVGCGLLVAAALIRSAVEREERDAGGFVIPLLLVIGGAVLVVVATVVPFTSDNSLKFQTVFARNKGWPALEPIGCAVFAVAVSLLLAKRRLLASGALIALGFFLMLLWGARYIAFPIWQVEGAATIGAGGFLGLAGGLAILVGGLRARPRERAGTVPGVGRMQGVS
jgi:uncharacterized membrane protein YidH (DUF202 family)